MLKIIEKNLFTFSLLLTGTSRGQHEIRSPISWTYTGTPALNRVFSQDIPEQQQESKIIDVVNRYRCWGGIPFTWFVRPKPESLHLAKRLEQHRISFDRRWSGMALDLAEFTKKMPIYPPLIVKQVRDPMMLGIWDQVRREGFQTNPIYRMGLRQVFTELGVGDQLPLRHYVGFLRDQPVGTCTLYTGEERVVGIYLVSTIPAYRGQGVATALMQQVLWEAYQQGGKVAVLQATEAGKRVYKKIGFKKYSDYHLHVWEGGRKELHCYD